MLTSGGIKFLMVLAMVHGALSVRNCGCGTKIKASCKEILAAYPNATSGLYKLGDALSMSEYVAYCDMNSPCGGKGWTRIANVDMSQPSTQCPSGLREYTEKGYRSCARPAPYTGCGSTSFSTRGIQYAEVCGRIIAYQYASTDAFHGSASAGIDDIYVDGISVTRGFPRKHVWTLAAGLHDTHAVGASYQCPCNTDGNNAVPTFVGDDYYCESGIQGRWTHILYSQDPLFDNKDCGPLETACCNKGIIPYFYKDMGSQSSDDVEVRICANEASGNEDTCITEIELFVR